MKRLKLKSTNQRGFTIIELLVTITIAALIGTAITTAFLQTFMLNARDSSHMTIVRQVQSAGHWLSQDAMMGKGLRPSPTPPRPEPRR